MAKEAWAFCGTTGGYAGGCRCEHCRAAEAAYKRRLRASYADRELPEVPHGRNRYWNYGCRCEVCKADSAAAARESYARRRAAAV